MLNISQQQRLQQKLSPQHVQYLKLLQLPTLVLEQRIKLELETNPLLEESTEEEIETTQEQQQEEEQTEKEEPTIELKQEREEEKSKKEDEFGWEEYLNADTSGYKTYSIDDDEERTEMPQPAAVSMMERLMDQLHLLKLNHEDLLLGEEIIGNIDEDGYLHRSLENILEDVNLANKINISLPHAEKVLKKIQNLEPVGIASRDLSECLLVQLKAKDVQDQGTKELACKILTEAFEDFTLRHYEDIARRFKISTEQLKKALDLIQHLNPKPGEGEISATENYVVPDFIVQNVDGEFIIQLNDKNVPPLRVSKAYRDIITNRKRNGVNKEAKAFVRQKLEAARWFINSIHQRRQTMLRVMHAIVDKQRNFFENGEGSLKPMVYRDIAEVIRMDISTISRVVNGKYVQTDYGVYELRYFFSESIDTSDGQEVSNKQVKMRIKQIIEAEDSHNPLNDDKICAMLRAEKYNVARRTVAKYREQMMIPVARMRRKI
jgi:RNA polymerase sigma-54 factor